MNKNDFTKLIYSGKYTLPLDSATKKTYKILVYRSTIDCGEIINIEIPEIPENNFILSAKDLKRRQHVVIDGVKIPLLANKNVSYIGEPILLLIGQNIQILKSIYKSIHVEYKETSPIKEVFFSKDISIGLSGSTEEKPYKIVSGTIRTPNRASNSQIIYGAFTKRESDNLILNSFSIWDDLLRDNISQICSVDSENIKIQSPTVSGEDEFCLYEGLTSAIYTTLVANQIKKNVLYTPTPENQYLYASKIYGINATWELLFDKESKLQQIKLDVILDAGAYPIFVKEKIYRILHGLTSFYRFKNINISVKAVRSNKPPGGMDKSLYLADATFISELLISKIIKEIGSDQYEWRSKHLLQKGYKNASASILKREIPLNKMLEKIVNQSDFCRKNSSLNLSLKRRDKRVDNSLKRGIGISVGYNGNSFISNDKAFTTNTVTMELNQSSKVSLSISCRIFNLDILTIWEDIIIEILDVERENISIITQDSIGQSAANIENKNIDILTPLIKQCSEEIKDRRFKDPLPIKQIKMTRRKSSLIWNPEKWKGIPFKGTSFAVCAIEVDIDKKSLDCYIKEIWIQLEVGQIINRQLLIKSAEREVRNTIKWLQEPEIQFDKNGLRSDDFYNKPKTISTPKINISLHETGKYKNIPKGLGSLIKNTLPGAYIQSVNQALGSKINTFPITREMVYKGLFRDEN